MLRRTFIKTLSCLPLFSFNNSVESNFHSAKYVLIDRPRRSGKSDFIRKWVNQQDECVLLTPFYNNPAWSGFLKCPKKKTWVITDPDRCRGVRVRNLIIDDIDYFDFDDLRSVIIGYATVVSRDNTKMVFIGDIEQSTKLRRWSRNMQADASCLFISRYEDLPVL